MKETINHIDDLIILSLCGELDHEGQRELRDWMAISDEHRNYVQSQEETWFSAINEKELAKYDASKAFESFLDYIGQARKGRPEITSHRLYRLLRYAAMIAVVALASFFAYQYGQKKLSREFAEIVIEPASGSRTRTVLPDGTSVWLNSGSRLTYSQGFGLIDRQVSLEGEGFFEVTKNKKLPFSVKSKTLQVNVLGTKFNFRDYPDDSEAEIVLSEGFVSLKSLIPNSHETQTLIPGQRAVLNKKTGQFEFDDYDSKKSRLWTQGFLVFDGESIYTIAKKLERCYGVKVTVSSKVLEQNHFYGDFIRQEHSLTDVLEALSGTGKLHYKINGKNVMLY